MLSNRLLSYPVIIAFLAVAAVALITVLASVLAVGWQVGQAAAAVSARHCLPIGDESQYQQDVATGNNQVLHISRPDWHAGQCETEQNYTAAAIEWKKALVDARVGVNALTFRVSLSVDFSRLGDLRSAKTQWRAVFPLLVKLVAQSSSTPGLPNAAGHDVWQRFAASAAARSERLFKSGNRTLAFAEYANHINDFYPESNPDFKYENGVSDFQDGLRLGSSGDFSGARTALNKSAGALPYYAPALMTLGYAHWALGDRTSATHDWENAARGIIDAGGPETELDMRLSYVNAAALDLLIHY